MLAMSFIYTTSINSFQTKQKYCDTSNHCRSPVVLSEQQTLPEFIKTHSGSLPLTALVVSGYQSEDGQVEISCNEVLRIHSLQFTPVVCAMKKNKPLPPIPLTTSTPFSVLYNPNSNRKEAMEGFMFNGVASLLSLMHMPKVVCVMKEWNGDSITISKGEILVINKRTLRGPNATPGIVTFSISTMTEKFLPEKCCGSFSTDPMLIQMPLQIIFAYISDPFPCEIYTPKLQLKKKNRSGLITLLGCGIIESVTFSIYDKCRGEYDTKVLQLDANIDTIELSLIEDPQATKLVSVVQKELLEQNSDSHNAVAQCSTEPSLSISSKSIKKQRQTFVSPRACNQPLTTMRPQSTQATLLPYKPLNRSPSLPPKPPHRAVKILPEASSNTSEDGNDKEVGFHNYEEICIQEDFIQHTLHEHTKHTIKRPALREHTKDTIKGLTLHDHTKDTIKTPTLHEHTKDTIKRPTLHEHTKDTIKTPKLHEHTKDTIKTPALHEHTKDTIKTPALHEHTKDTIKRPALHEHTKDMIKRPTINEPFNVETATPKIEVGVQKLLHKFKSPLKEKLDYHIVSKPLSLLQFVSLYSSQLPVFIHVCSNASSVSSSKYLHVTAMESEQVVLAEDYTMKQICIPMTSTEKYSILHRPTGTEDIKDALQGNTYCSISDLMKLKNTPKVVCTTKPWRDAVVDNEILIVQSILFSQGEKRGIIAFSTYTRSEKFIPNMCRANFTTAANLLGLPVIDLVKYVPQLFPCNACCVKCNSTPECSPKEVVTLKEVSSIPMLVCTPIGAGDPLEPPVRIPINSPGVEVAVMENAKQQNRGLQLDTESLVCCACLLSFHYVLCPQTSSLDSDDYCLMFQMNEDEQMVGTSKAM